MNKPILHILQQGESEHIEFKTSFSDEVITSLVAFANTKCGTVYVGVTDKGETKGVEIGKETIQNWLNEIKNKTTPMLLPEVENLLVKNKTIVRLQLKEYPIKPVSFKGRYYQRKGNANHQLSVSEVSEMHLRTFNSSWDAYPNPRYSIDEISLDKVQNSIETMKNRGITIQESPYTFLLKNDLIREEKPTNAAYLMFKNKESIDTTIELGRFQDFITIKDTSRTKKDIITQVDEVLEFVKKHINVALIITGKAENIQKWQYPLEAIREIVLNMIIHRDYRANSSSVVKIFDDKIEFYNPGKLPEGIRIQDLIENNYKSTPRNITIAEFFKNLGWIEKYGSGIGRIINYFKEEKLPAPEFKSVGEGFQVMVFTPFIKDKEVNNSIVGVNVGVNVGLNKVLEIIKDKPGINSKDLYQAFDVTTRTIERWLKQLREEDKIEFKGAPKTGGYYLKEKKQ